MLGKLFPWLFKQSEKGSCNLSSELEEQLLITSNESSPPPETQTQTLWRSLLREPNSPYLTFVDVCKDTTHQFKLPESVLGGGFCCCKGSGHGWLALDTYQKNDDRQIVLIDPVSGHQIALPPFEKKNQDCDIAFIRISKSSPSGIVVATIINSENLAICESGSNEGWKIMQGLLDDQLFFCDLLFSSDGKTLYASTLSKINYTPPRPIQSHQVTLPGGQEIVLKILPDHSRHPDERVTCLVESESDLNTVTKQKHKQLLQYLVESESELFTVYRKYDVWTTYCRKDEEVVKSEYTCHTSTFEVRKLDHLTGQVVSTLTDLGDRSLFISQQGTSFLLPTKDSNSNGLERNSIYFLEDSEYEYWEKVTQHEYSQDSGVFSIKDGSIKRILPSRDLKKQCPMVWFSPNLKTGSDIQILVH